GDAPLRERGEDAPRPQIEAPEIQPVERGDGGLFGAPLALEPAQRPLQADVAANDGHERGYDPGRGADAHPSAPLSHRAVGYRGAARSGKKLAPPPRWG